MQRVKDFVAASATVELEWLSVPHDRFHHVNTPEDLAEAAAVLHARQT